MQTTVNRSKFFLVRVKTLVFLCMTNMWKESLGVKREIYQIRLSHFFSGNLLHVFVKNVGL